MGLIRKWNATQQLSVKEKQAVTKAQMVEMITELFDHMKLAYFRGQRLVKQNPLGLTQKEVEQGFGEDTYELMRLAVLLKDVINIAQPGTIPDEDPYGNHPKSSHRK